MAQADRLNGLRYHDQFFHALFDEGVALRQLHKEEFRDGQKASLSLAMSHFIIRQSAPEKRELLLRILNHPAVRDSNWDRFIENPDGTSSVAPAARNQQRSSDLPFLTSPDFHQANGPSLAPLWRLLIY